MEERLRILLCEDDENLGMLLREYLQAKGYAADLFSDGESGYKAFLKGKYDLCVLDVMMPKKDGFTLAQEIRTINSEVPIIFLTAKSLKEDILEGFKIGADDYITKPFSVGILKATVKNILTNRALLRRAYNSIDEKEPNFPPIGLDTQIMLAYSNNDMLAENMESYFNSDCRETYAITPVTYMYLTPETDRLFRMDDYPERLSKWMQRFMQHITGSF